MEDSREFIKTIYRTQRQYKYMAKTWPDLVQEIELNCQDDIPWPEKLYLFQEGLHHRPVCHCGRECTFISPIKGYTSTCSPACASRPGGEKFEKIHTTMMERYGVAHALQSDELQAKRRRTNLKRHGDEGYNNRDKYKKTSIERYGGVGGAALSIKDKVIRTTTERYGGMGLASAETRAKIENTNLERYGVRNPLQSDEIRKKVVATTRERYGVDNPTKSKKISTKVSESLLIHYQQFPRPRKIKPTCVDRWGVDNVFKLPEIQAQIQAKIRAKYGNMGAGSDIISKHIQQTNQERYSANNPWGSSKIRQKIYRTMQERYGGNGLSSGAIREKIETTNLKRWGSPHPMQCEKIVDRMRQSRRTRVIAKGLNNICGYTDSGDWIVQCDKENCTGCQDKTFIIPAGVYHDRKRRHAELCTNLFPIQPSNIKNTYIEQFVRHILDEHGIKYTTNDRNIIPPQEVDIYLPDYKIAIECNGIYWHSDRCKDRNYHYNK